MSSLALKAARELTPNRDIGDIEAKYRAIEAWVAERDTCAGPKNYRYSDTVVFRVTVEEALADAQGLGETEAKLFIARADRYLALRLGDRQC